MADEHKQQAAVLMEAVETRLGRGGSQGDAELRVELAKVHVLLHIADKLDELKQAIHKTMR